MVEYQPKRYISMKTYFVVAEGRVDQHDGEEYDDILYVEDAPTTDTIQEWANRIRQGLRKLWHEGGQEPIGIYFDAHMAFHAVLVNLQILMKEDEDIDLSLMYEEQIPKADVDDELAQYLNQ